MTAWGRAELESLYERLRTPLYNVCYRIVWDREEALDLVQESFVILWFRRKRIRPETVEALAYRTAINLARSLLRKRKIRRMTGLDRLLGTGGSGDPEADLLADERERRLKEAIVTLPDELRDTLLLTEYAELSHRSVGEILGIKEGTVASRHFRAIERLRGAFPEPSE